MKVFISFTIGALIGSGLTYLYLTRSIDEFEDEDGEMNKNDENKESKEKPVVIENMSNSKAEAEEYHKMVSNITTTKPVTSEPYLITEKAYHESHADYEKVSLNYYAEDGTLANDDIIIDDLDYTIGLNNLREFGANDVENPNVLYIRNEELGTDYEVEWQDKSYEDDYPQDYDDFEEETY